MRGLTRRLLPALAVAALAAAAAPASAEDVTIPGCYGAVVAVCDPTVRVYGVEVESRSHPVCVGSCTYVNGPWVRFTPVSSEDPIACVTWTWESNGSTGGTCP